LAELERIAEEQRLADEAAEQARIAEEARQAELARIAEEQRLADEAEQARLEEEARLAEEARIAEEARLAEEARIAEEQRLADEAAEQARIAEEARLAEEERKRLEEEEKNNEEEEVVERDISPDLLGWARVAYHVNNKPMCAGCEGDIGECRWSWPLSDTKKGNSELADWRCKPVYKFGQACNNNVMHCEDWCERYINGDVYGCRWSIPVADITLDDPKGKKSVDAACRCDMDRQEFTFKGKEAKSAGWGICDGCTGENEVCR